VTILGPSLDWREDAFRDTEDPVNVAVDLLASSIARTVSTRLSAAGNRTVIWTGKPPRIGRSPH